MGTIWTLQDAKNKFSAVVEAAQAGEPQRVTKRGTDAVVVLSVNEFERLTALDKGPKKTFTDHLLDFPKLPEGMDDFLDFDDRPQISPREIEFRD